KKSAQKKGAANAAPSRSATGRSTLTLKRLLLGDRSLDLFGQLGDAGAQRRHGVGLALGVEVGQLLGVGDRRLVGLLHEVDLLGGLLLDGRGGEDFAAVLGEVF